MSVDLTLHLKLTVEDLNQLKTLMDAVESGRASHILKSCVLYGAQPIFLGANGTIPDHIVSTSAQPVIKREEQVASSPVQASETVELKQLDTVSHGKAKVEPEPTKKPRSHGIMGRGRLNRTGG